MRQPGASSYVFGWGVSDAERRAFLRRYLADGSPDDLALAPGSALRAALLAEATGSTAG